MGRVGTNSDQGIAGSVFFDFDALRDDGDFGSLTVAQQYERHWIACFVGNDVAKEFDASNRFAICLR